MEFTTQHFKMIFWLLAGCMAAAFVYIYLITFMVIPKENIRFADTAQGFMLGTVIAGILGFFIGASVMNSKNKPAATPGVTTTNVDIQATTTTDNTKIEEDVTGKV